MYNKEYVNSTEGNCFTEIDYCCEEHLSKELPGKVYDVEYFVCGGCGKVHVAFLDGSFLSTEEIKIEGLEQLNYENQYHILETNSEHLDTLSEEEKKKMLLNKVWVNEDGIVCGRLLNGEKYHYYKDGTWCQ